MIRSQTTEIKGHERQNDEDDGPLYLRRRKSRSTAAKYSFINAGQDYNQDQHLGISVG